MKQPIQLDYRADEPVQVRPWAKFLLIIAAAIAMGACVLKWMV